MSTTTWKAKTRSLFQDSAYFPCFAIVVAQDIPRHRICSAKVGLFALSSRPRRMEGWFAVGLVNPFLHIFCIGFCFSPLIVSSRCEMPSPPFSTLLLVFSLPPVSSFPLFGHPFAGPEEVLNLPVQFLGMLWFHWEGYEDMGHVFVFTQLHMMG
jgi:hypothetical protein